MAIEKLPGTNIHYYLIAFDENGSNKKTLIPVLSSSTCCSDVRSLTYLFSNMAGKLTQ